VTHDTWKSGVLWLGTNNTLLELNVYGGANSSTYTHDVQPHGSVIGNTISSPTMFIVYGLDWRKTMQDVLPDENLKIRAQSAWTNGVPFGWNSLGTCCKRQSAIRTPPMPRASSTAVCNRGNFQRQRDRCINLDSYGAVNLSPTQVQSFVSFLPRQRAEGGTVLRAVALVRRGFPTRRPRSVPGTSYT